MIDAMYRAYSDRESPHRDVTTEDISTALAWRVRMSESQSEAFGILWQWLEQGRARSASFREVQQAQAQFMPLQIRS